MYDLLIPEEYLLLRKEYLTTLLDRMPVVKLGRRGAVPVLRLYNGKRDRFTEISQKSRKWDQYYDLYHKRDMIDTALRRINRLLRSRTRTSMSTPLLKDNRSGSYDNDYYDRLTDCSCTYDKTSDYYYGGRNYRSRAEMMFAAILDEFGLEYKYDVEVSFYGKRFTVDFVVIFREFNRCIFIEYFGKCSEREYLEDNSRKLINAQLYGIYINRDMFIVSGDKNYSPGPGSIRIQISAIICLLAENHIEIVRSDIKA